MTLQEKLKLFRAIKNKYSIGTDAVALPPTDLNEGPVLKTAPSKELQQLYEREAKAQRYMQKQEKNRNYAKRLFPAIVAAMGGDFPGMLEFFGATANVFHDTAKQNLNTNNSVRNRLNTVAKSKYTNLIGDISGFTADALQFSENPSDVQNNIELGADVAKAASDFGFIRKIPRIGKPLDKVIKVAPTVANYNDAILKPTYRFVDKFVPDWLKVDIPFQMAPQGYDIHNIEPHF